MKWILLSVAVITGLYAMLKLKQAALADDPYLVMTPERKRMLNHAHMHDEGRLMRGEELG